MQGFLDFLAVSAVPENLTSAEAQLGAELTVLAVEQRSEDASERGKGREEVFDKKLKLTTLPSFLSSDLSLPPCWSCCRFSAKYPVNKPFRAVERSSTKKKSS